MDKKNIINLVIWIFIMGCILYSNFISIELKLAILCGLVGLILEFVVLIYGLKKHNNLDCSLWQIIMSRDIYNENKSYYDLFKFALKDFYVTIVLLLYTSFMIIKFFGIHISYNKNISSYNKNDIIIIIWLTFISGILIFK
tara:strand:+ start:109 stop:531 length:423 start_codon:yes stop_codon:yes gene_type:complete